MRRWGMLLGALVGVVLLGGAQPAAAQTVIDTGSWDGTSTWSPFGAPNTATYGQTFKAPTENRLDRFSFMLKPGGAPVHFKFFVMGWDGSKAVGPVLYQSSTVTAPANSSMQTYTTETGGISLTTGAQYVAFVNADFSVSGGGVAQMAAASNHANTYADGNFVYYNNGANFGLLTSNSWDKTGGSDDVQFRAEFNSAAAAVPEPSAALLFLPALAVLGILKRRRS